MQVVKDNLWLCSDCTFVACNGSHGMDIKPEELAIVEAGLAELGPHLVPDFDSEEGIGCTEFSSRQCASCLSNLAGYRARFAILGDSEPEHASKEWNVLCACSAEYVHVGPEPNTCSQCGSTDVETHAR